MSANHVLIASIETTSLTNYVTFSNIPQTGFSDLKIVMAGRDSGDDLVRFSMAFNTTSKQTFTRRVLYGVGTGTGSSTFSTNTSIGYGTVRNTGTSNTFGNCEILIPNYSSSSAKSFLVEGAEENNSADAIMGISSGYTTNTEPIKSISIFSDAPYLAIGSKFSLYGITSVGKEAEISPKAYGGDIVANDGEYWYHAFLTTGAFKPRSPLNCDVLVVAGGGGSPAAGTGAGPSGGGGAGGVLSFLSQSLSPISYTCTVGSGGANTVGGDSQFGALTLVKGGGVGGTTDNVGGTGGSGGGSGGRYTSSGGAATSGQGYDGGIGYQQSGLASGGGGGAAQLGWGAASNAGGYGGNGTNAYSSWLSNVGLGVNGYIAGGGAGMSWYGGSGGVGGSGGGGNGASGSTGSATAGTASTGSGGGGSSYGSNGGSGFVIVRYAMA